MKVYVLAWYSLRFDDAVTVDGFDVIGALEGIGRVLDISDGTYLLLTNKDAIQIREMLQAMCHGNRFIVAEVDRAISHLSDGHATYITNQLLKG